MSVYNARGAWSLIPMDGAKLSLPRLRIIKGSDNSRVPIIHATPAIAEVKSTRLTALTLKLCLTGTRQRIFIK